MTVRAEPDAELHRAELTGHCYRMLGSAFEAEDAVQETLVRAWRHRERFDPERAQYRTWLHAIATHVCLDMTRSTQRRARAMDLGPASAVGSPLGVPLPESAWVLPVPDARVLPAGGDPAELAAARESVRLAFVAALQLLPPRQRAVLLLRDVLCFPAADVAAQLDTTVASVTSALQRARATLRAAGDPPEPLRPDDPVQRDLLARYCDAFECYDIEELVALLHEDATTSMPPFTWWLQGRADIRTTLLAAGRPCEGARLVPVGANGSPAFWQTRPTGADGAHEPFALVLFDVVGGQITGTTTFLDVPRLLPLFGAPITDEFGVAAS